MHKLYLFIAFSIGKIMQPTFGVVFAAGFIMPTEARIQNAQATQELQPG